MIKVFIFSKLRINYSTYNIYMTENTHSVYHFRLLTSLVDLAYLLQNQLQESTLLKLLCGGVCVCMQMFSQVYCICENKKCKRKVKKIIIIIKKKKSKLQGRCFHMCSCMCGMCIHLNTRVCVSWRILINKHNSVGRANC